MSRTAPFRVAAIQATPVFLDREKTIDKACALIADAARGGAKLALFPESFVPAYPDWVWVVPPGKKKLLDPLYAEFLDNAVTVPGPDTDRLCDAARRGGIYVAIGITERNAAASNMSLFNSLLSIAPDGRILGVHRKLVPTGGERLMWTGGDGSTLEPYHTPLGTIGGLICWENYMPLARYALYAWGTQIYLAPTWDYGETWIATMRHIAKEGRVFVIGCCMPLRLSDIPDRYEFKKLYDSSKEWINPGESVIVAPDGTIAAGPLSKSEGILYAQVDPHALGQRWILDVAGHYARPDVFEFAVRTDPRPVIRTPFPRKGMFPGRPRAKPRGRKSRNEREAP